MNADVVEPREGEHREGKHLDSDVGDPRERNDREGQHMEVQRRQVRGTSDASCLTYAAAL